MPTSLRWIAARRDRLHPEYPPSFSKGEQFLGVLKLQTQARILALKALLLMTDLAVSLRVIFWRKRWMNSQAPSTPVCQMRRKKTLASQQQSQFTRLGATVHGLDDAQFLAVAEAPASGAR